MILNSITYECGSKRTITYNNVPALAGTYYHLFIRLECNFTIQNFIRVDYTQWIYYSQRPKTERSVFRQRRKPNKALYEVVCSVFGLFGSKLCCSVPIFVRFQNCLKSEQICSDFRHKSYKSYMALLCVGYEQICV